MEPIRNLVVVVFTQDNFMCIIRPFRGALRELYLKYVFPGLENVLTALTNINRAGHGIRVR